MPLGSVLCLVALYNLQGDWNNTFGNHASIQSFSRSFISAHCTHAHSLLYPFSSTQAVKTSYCFSTHEVQCVLCSFGGQHFKNTNVCPEMLPVSLKKKEKRDCVNPFSLV